MATQFAFGKVVTDGLVLALDASDRSSYPGSGATWRDVSTGQNNGSFASGVSYQSDNSILIPTSSYINLGTNSNIRNFYQNNVSMTFQALINKSNITGSSVGPTGFVLFSNNDCGWVQGWSLSIRNSVSSSNNAVFQVGYSSTRDAILYSTALGDIENKWIDLAVTYTVNNLQSTGSIYLNGVKLYTSSSAIVALGSSNAYNNYIGRQTSITWQGHTSQGKIASYKIYNRVLSDTEIQQNYNAQKSRFGLS